MAHGTTTITAPVVMPTDIAAILQISGTNLQTICQSPAINMWAKWKPIQYTKVAQLTDTERQNSNYGIKNIPTWDNIGKMANFWLGLNTSSTNAPDCGIQPAYWDYQRPSSYFRLSDFSNYAKTAGYLHTAEAPIGGASESSYTINSQGTLRITYDSAQNTDAQAIQLGDLVYPQNIQSQIGNFYFGVFLYNVSSGAKYAVTSNRISDLPTYGAWVDITGLSSSFNGTYKVFPFASRDQISFTSNPQMNGSFVALHEVDEVGIGATVTKIDIGNFTAYRTPSDNRFLHELIYLENNMAVSVTFHIYFEVFNSVGTVIYTDTKSNIQLSGGGSMTYGSGHELDMGSTLLGQAASVRATVTPISGQTNVSTYAVCSVTDGPSPY